MTISRTVIERTALTVHNKSKSTAISRDLVHLRRRCAFFWKDHAMRSTHQFTRLARGAVTLAIGTASLAVLADNLSGDQSSVQSSCSHKTDKIYGFVCQGFAQVVPGAGLEPIGQVGVVSGSPTGIFDGYATISASIGSVRQHVRGQAVFQDRTCFGHIQYRVWIALPNGDGPELPRSTSTSRWSMAAARSSARRTISAAPAPMSLGSPAGWWKPRTDQG